MKKLFKIIYLKRIIYLSLAVSWIYFLTIMVEIKDDLQTIEYDLVDIRYNSAHFDNIDSKLNAIDSKLKYDFSSVYLGSYEGIKHFRYNRETGTINKRDGRSFGGWGSPFGSE